jgi:hypothetical protein
MTPMQANKTMVATAHRRSTVFSLIAFSKFLRTGKGFDQSCALLCRFFVAALEPHGPEHYDNELNCYANANSDGQQDGVQLAHARAKMLLTWLACQVLPPRAV